MFTIYIQYVYTVYIKEYTYINQSHFQFIARNKNIVAFKVSTEKCKIWFTDHNLFHYNRKLDIKENIQ